MSSEEPLEPARKRSSISKLFLPFRKNSIPKSSTNGSGCDTYSSDTRPTETRRSSKPSSVSSTPVSSARITNSDDSMSSDVPDRKVDKPSTTKFQDPFQRDRVTGEVKDPTNMLHSIAHEFDMEPVGIKTAILEPTTPAIPPAQLIDRLSDGVWQRVISHLEVHEIASLSLSSHCFERLCPPEVLRSLNHRQRCDFLQLLDVYYPSYLLCYICARYHRRSNSGGELLKPANISNPVYECPYTTSTNKIEQQSRLRITFNRTLPYSFLKLAVRHQVLSPKYGVDSDKLLSRRYKDRPEVGTWSHQTRYAVIDESLYMRVTSTAFATANLPPAGLRHLLYSREDFIPFFSVCSHWRDGLLMPACKCALGHIPSDLKNHGPQRVADVIRERVLEKKQGKLVRMCELCKPLRRCPECPTEYLIEIRLSEDRTEADPTKLFKHAIIVTRWSNLGDGSAPWDRKWAAITGEHFTGDGWRIPKEYNFKGDELVQQDNEWEGYDSFKELGRRAISGVFESFFNPEQIPPQLLMSLNPEGKKLGERGHNWY